AAALGEGAGGGHGGPAALRVGVAERAPPAALRVPDREGVEPGLARGVARVALDGVDPEPVAGEAVGELELAPGELLGAEPGPVAAEHREPGAVERHPVAALALCRRGDGGQEQEARSEEHTSELQSR